MSNYTKNSGSLFPPTDLFPICMTAMAVKVICKNWNRVFGPDSSHLNYSSTFNLMSILQFFNFSVIPSLKFQLLHSTILTMKATTSSAKKARTSPRIY
jgi:hypothetical protein